MYTVPHRKPPRPQRIVSLVLIVLCLAFVTIAVAGARTGRQELLALGIGGFVPGLVGLTWITWSVRRRTRAARVKAAQHAMTLMLVAELGRHDDATLERIARSRGPAADVARGLLAERHRKARGSS